MAETNMCNRFDFVSNGKVVYKGTQFTEYEDVEQPKPKEPEEKKFDGSSLTGKVLGAVAAAGCVAAAFGLVAAWGVSAAFSGGAAFAAAPLVWQGFAFLMAAAPIAMEAGNAISKQYNQDVANQKDSGWGTYAKISIGDPVVVGARESAIGLVGGAAAAKLFRLGSKLMGKMFKPRGSGVGYIPRKQGGTSRGSSNNYSSVRFTGTTKVAGKVKDISRKVYQRSDIDWNRIDPETGMSNLQLAQKGRSPYWNDGAKIELHHLTQREPGSMVEIPASLHDKYSKILHGLVENGGSFRNNLELEKQYNNFRLQYWKWRAGEI